MKNIFILYLLFFILSCLSSKKAGYQDTKNNKVKENYLANEADKVIEYNKQRKKAADKTKEKTRIEEQKKLNELNHQKHEPAQKKKKEAGEFKMF